MGTWQLCGKCFLSKGQLGERKWPRDGSIMKGGVKEGFYAPLVHFNHWLQTIRGSVCQNVSCGWDSGHDTVSSLYTMSIFHYDLVYLWPQSPFAVMHIYLTGEGFCMWHPAAVRLWIRSIFHTSWTKENSHLLPWRQLPLWRNSGISLLLPSTHCYKTAHWFICLHHCSDQVISSLCSDDISWWFYVPIIVLPSIRLTHLRLLITSCVYLFTAFLVLRRIFTV